MRFKTDTYTTYYDTVETTIKDTISGNYYLVVDDGITPNIKIFNVDYPVEVWLELRNNFDIANQNLIAGVVDRIETQRTRIVLFEGLGIL